MPSGANSAREMERLRHLILKTEQDQIRELTARLEDPVRRSGEIARVLPEAVAKSTGSGPKLADALAPTVQEIIDDAIRRNRDGFINSFYPIMGPAIRKAIAEAIRRMLQGLNQALEKSVSIQGVLWRIEAAKTGKPFAEVVLLHSLIFRVEQVFLIHRESGVLLLHGVRESEVVQDADMVAAMLTAIQDFIRDSFQSPGEDTLETIQMGDVTLNIEQGPDLVLAAVIRGNAPESLRDSFQSVLERIHLDQEAAIQRFSGDTAPFEPSRPLLESCLEARFKKKRISPVIWIGAGLMLTAAGLWGYRAALDHVHWRRYIDALRRQPGIVVTMAEEGFGKRRVAGFRDPLAADPARLLSEHGLEADAVAADWEPYFALHPDLVLKRARRHLQPPAGVTLELSDHVLYVEGTAPSGWCARLEGRSMAIPGVLEVDTTRLVNSDVQQFSSLEQSIEALSFQFGKGQSALAPGDQGQLADAAHKIDTLLGLAGRIGRSVHIRIVGCADSSGTPEQNLQISKDRADHVREALVAYGIPGSMLTPYGAGTDAGYEAALDGDGSDHRRVTLDIIHAPAPDTKVW